MRNTRTDMPDFSFIRSNLDRAEAEWSYKTGVALADGLYNVSQALGRAISSIARTVSRKPITDW